MPPAADPPPDYRFSLANERTLLASLRTALALVAGGVAVAQFAPSLGVHRGGSVIAVLLVLAGLGTALAGYRRYRRNEDGMAAGLPLPDAGLPGRLTASLTALVLLVLVLVVVEAVRT